MSESESGDAHGSAARVPPLWQRARWPLLLASISLAFGFAPLLVTLVARQIAIANDCRLHEGHPNPCTVGGLEVGDLLYSMGITFWLALVTLPMMVPVLAGSFLWLLVEVGRHVAARTE